MKNNLTELVFILDKSGSMAGLEEDTIGGFNSLLEKQKKEKGEAVITTVLFDNSYEVLHDRENIRQVPPITKNEYYIGGSTALLDALGRTINRVGKALSETGEQERPGKVMVVIITDGMENASREFKYSQIKHMIEHQKAKYSWEFLFLGANIDAVEAASQFGIAQDRAANYHADSSGTRLNYDVVSCAVSELRQCEEISPGWKAKIDKDFEKRGKNK